MLWTFIIAGIIISLGYWAFFWTPTFIRALGAYINDSPMVYCERSFYGIIEVEDVEGPFVLFQAFVTFMLSALCGFILGVVALAIWPLLILAGVGYVVLRGIRYSKRLKKSLKPLIDSAHTHEDGEIRGAEIQTPEL